MRDELLLRYARHIMLESIGIEGQSRWQASHVAIVGLGGLGSAAAMYLASSGVGTLSLIDDDKVALSNLQRQIIHTTEHIDRPKVESARDTLLQLNPHITIHTHQQRATDENLNSWIEQESIHLLLDCSDNFETRHAINRIAYAKEIPWVLGAAIGMKGQAALWESKAGCPCYACLFPTTEPPPLLNCANTGIFAPLVGIVGSMQAAQALLYLAGLQAPLSSKLWHYNAPNGEQQTFAINPDPACSICGASYSHLG